jgi:SpoVK/Ycf46/Vps4 family AAA+-type ATPase
MESTSTATATSTSIVPFTFTKSLGSSWYQVSGVDSGNVSLRGGNHSGNGHLSVGAGSHSNFMLVHYNVHSINTNLISYDLRFLARWEGLDEQLHLVLFYHSSADYCILSIRPRQGRSLLRQCATSPSDDPAALARGQIIAEFDFDPMILPSNDSVTVNLRLTVKSFECTISTLSAPLPTASSGVSLVSSQASNGTASNSTVSMTVFEWSTSEDGDSSENPGLQLDLSQGCVAGVLVTCASRLFIREWKVRTCYPNALTAQTARVAITHNTNVKPLPETSETPNRIKAFSSEESSTLANASVTTPSRTPIRPNSVTSIYHRLNASQQNNATNNSVSLGNTNSATTNALNQLFPGIPPDRLQRLQSLPFEREILNAILADLLLPVSSSTSSLSNDTVPTSTNTFHRVSLEDIAGLDNAKRLLSEAIILPTLLPAFFAGNSLRTPWRGILLFGPPGTGKTLLARAVATLQTSMSSNAQQANSVSDNEGYKGGAFFNCSAASLVSKWRGDSEKLVKCLFHVARCVAPSVVFIDEVDALVTSRGGSGEHEASRRMKTEFFAQMDGIVTQESSGEGRTIVLATTNCPWDLDPAVLRRFEKRIYVPLPDKPARQAHFALCLRQLIPVTSPPSASSILETERNAWIEHFAELSEGFSSADIVTVCREAAMAPMRRLLASHSLQDLASLSATQAMQTTQTMVTLEDILEALRRTRPSVPAASIERYAAWNEQYGTAPADATY